MKIIKTSKYKNKLRGGLADDKTPSNFNKEDVDRGRIIELEHTNDPDTAKDIAMDHLEEFPTYYTELDKMEKKLEDK